MAIDINKMMSISGSYSKHKKGEVPFRRILPPEYMEDAKKEIPLEGEPVDNADMYNGVITDIPMPKTSKNLSLPFPVKDKKIYLEAFSDVVRKLDVKDEVGKEFLIQVLEGYSQMK